ncbi:MAG TPA: DUF354 domain-containing protein [Candidatus Eisenbacteria bacterium]|jgi:predicted glycosyltransferase|nr:DUF354 domain-containing protein [Candidatus Eisenbacteria bacterium]
MGDGLDVPRHDRRGRAHGAWNHGATARPLTRHGGRLKVWIDVDNAPHVQFFRPVIRRLHELGADVHVTARDRTYVPQLLHSFGIRHTVIGHGRPESTMAKARVLAARTALLMRYAAGKKFDVAIGHGSRALAPAAKLSGVKNLTMFDYEHVSTWIFRTFCDRILIPRATMSRMKELKPQGRWVPFDGFKEEVYLAEYVVDPSIRLRLGVKPADVLVTLRPPATTAHYHDPKSEGMLRAITARLGSTTNVRTVWLRRDLADPIPNLEWVPSFIVPRRPLDGPSLLAAADVVISGGGTMTREAALLGTPAYSIFTGPTGAIDEELNRRGSLVLVRSVEEADRIPFVKKSENAAPRCTPALREFVIDQIQELARSKGRARVAVADEASGKGGQVGSSVR